MSRKHSLNEEQQQLVAKESKMDRVYVIEEWEGSSFQKWAKNFCYKNQWRVASILGDYEDCLAYCAMSYVICRKNYGHTVKTPQQFMYMFNLWVIAEFNTMSSKDSRSRKYQQTLSSEEESIESNAQLAVKLSEASSELTSVLAVLLNSPKEIIEVLRQEAHSCHPKQFWKATLKFCGIKQERSAILAKELQDLLSK